MKTALKIDSWGISDVGLTRPNNEDAWAIAAQGHFFAVADGMGGHRAGEVAARETIQTLCRFMDKLFAKKPKFSTDQVSIALSTAIRETNSHVYALSLQHPDLSGMGTTLACFLLHEHILLTAHVGDSRIYRYRGELELLTKDHVMRSQGASSGRKMITRAIGTSAAVEPDCDAIPVLAEDIYFLCSDGLSDYVTAKEMSLILRKTTSIQEACMHLVTAAKTKGSSDNITIVMVKILL